MNTIKHTQRYTVRANRGKPRIWIEGTRLVDCGFVPGSSFALQSSTGQDFIVLFVNWAADSRSLLNAQWRKVSGHRDRPVIDLAGASCSPFETGDEVEIEYHQYPDGSGAIVITRA